MGEQSMKTQLLPCPFCGGEASAGRFETYSMDSSFDYIGCDNCEVMIPFHHAQARSSAIAAWNRRSPPAAVPNGWQPITTAPKDKYVLVWDPTHEVARVACAMTAIETGETDWVYARQLSIQADDGVALAFIVREPTHWQPGPAAPTEASDE